jgi:sulfur carrier protein ThiS
MIMSRDDAIEITIRLFASFRRDRFPQALRQYPVGARVADVLADLGIRPAQVGMILVSGRRADAERILGKGDSVSLFPLIGGG